MIEATTAAPLVSILTPSFRHAPWLADNLRSVGTQTYPFIEHIVIDGGSEDGSVDILKAAQWRGLRWRSEPDRGQSDAINKAFAESRGSIIGWVNSDDAYFSPDVVAAAVDVFQRHPDVDVVYGHAALVDAAGLVLQLIWVPRFRYRMLKLHNFIVQPTAFVRRSALGITVVDEAYEFAMDRELWLRLGQASHFARLDRIVAIDRHQAGRKVYTRWPLVAEENRRLAAAYDAPDGPMARAQLKALKIAFRLAGVLLLPEARRRLAFHGRVDSTLGLVRRQILTPRARMGMAE
jgi:glycosyltransferase involved in cell wall biosynthesis